MDSSLVDVILTQAGTGGVAVLALWMLNKVWGLRCEEIKRERDRERTDKLLVITVLQENTGALMGFTKAVERLDRLVEKNGG